QTGPPGIEASRQIHFRSKDNTQKQCREAKTMIDRCSDVDGSISVEMDLGKQGDERWQEIEDGWFAAGRLWLPGGSPGHYHNVARCSFFESYLCLAGPPRHPVDAIADRVIRRNSLVPQRRLFKDVSELFIVNIKVEPQALIESKDLLCTHFG